MGAQPPVTGRDRTSGARLLPFLVPIIADTGMAVLGFDLSPLREAIGDLTRGVAAGVGGDGGPPDAGGERGAFAAFLGGLAPAGPGGAADLLGAGGPAGAGGARDLLAAGGPPGAG